MQIKFTGRILDWFVKDLRALAARGVQFHALPYQETPYRPPGLWCVTPPGPDRPTLWSFPQPLHPIEAIAALRGFGGYGSDVWRVKAIAQDRARPWVEYTAILAERLFVRRETLRLVWHLLTPLTAAWPVRGYTSSVWHAQDRLWSSVFGTDGRPLLQNRGEGPERTAFWTEEVTGEIEL